MASRKRNPAGAESAGLGNVHLADDSPRNNPTRRQSSTVEVYSGLNRLGTVERHPRDFRAIDAEGHSLGDFVRERDAMQAITQASALQPKFGGGL